MKKRVSIVVAGAWVSLFLAALTLGGCVSGRSDVTYGPKGPPVGHSTLKQIRIDRTSKEWLLGTLGAPTRQTRTPEGTEILTYEYIKKIDSDLDVFLILDFDDKREERTVLYFELTDGVVTRFWKE